MSNITELSEAEKRLNTILDSVVGSFERTIKLTEAAEGYGDAGEAFDGWLPLTLASSKKYYDFTLAELQTVRDAVRTVYATNEVAKNIDRHYQNFIVGSGPTLTITSEDLGDDPVKLAAQKEDSTIAKMKENWKLFVIKNQFNARLRNWVTRCHRDGEAILRVFNTADAPTVRFIDPYYMQGDDPKFDMGVAHDPKDIETPVAYFYTDPDTNQTTKIPAEEVIHDKRNVDMDALRGIPTIWPCMTNLRRCEKVLVNSSVLAAVQAAITMVRKHKNATQAQVANFLNNKSDNTARVDSVTGRTYRSQKVKPGTILDGSMDTDYEFPAHNINAGSFIDIAKHELSHIASCVVLPVEWLLAAEPTDPLTPGSPVVANFRTEQDTLYTHVEELFWRVQVMMGIGEDTRLKYNVKFHGPRLAIGKALDEARVDEILIRNGATSPQDIAAKHGNTWAISRANMIRHRATAQEGEVMPGDSGNSNPGIDGGDGSSTKDGSQRKNEGDGGNNK